LSNSHPILEEFLTKEELADELGLNPRTLDGIPYELERTVCRACDRVLNERPLRRAAA